MSLYGENILRTDHQRGIVLIVCMILLLMLSLIGIASMTSSNTELTISGNEVDRTGTFYAAESGLEVAYAAIKASYEATGSLPDSMPSGTQIIGNFQFEYGVTDRGPATNTILTSGAYSGLNGLVKIYDISSVGSDNFHESYIQLNMSIQDVLIPVYQFAVFYENDLEIAPGPDMTLGGRVHSNGDIYLQAGSNLYINSDMTSTGNILHGSKPGSGNGTSNGDVYITDSNGNYQSMRSADGTFLDSTDPDWVNLSNSRWGGNVRDSDHGTTGLHMPLGTGGATTDIIDRGQGNPDSFEHQAGLKFVDGLALYRNPDGSWQDITSTLTSSGAISTGNFDDGREGQEIISLDIDITLLAASGYYPPNGIIYASESQNTGNLSAVRLTNGAQLPSGLTVATNNPLYTLGDYNTINKQPASLMADAVTILSNNWDDANSHQDLSYRNASATTVNACYMTGNTESGSNGQGYSGGLENLPRFLENWSGVTFTWRGSAVDLWNSRYANSPWGGSYYSPPDRDWGFDPDLLDPTKLPPGTPVVNVILRTGWWETVSTD